MLKFDPYLSSRPLVTVLNRSPSVGLIINEHNYRFSSVFFYADRTALRPNGRFINLPCGPYAPDTPNVFIDDSQWRSLWRKPQRYHILARISAVPRLVSLVGSGQLDTVDMSGKKVLLTNHPQVVRNSRLLIYFFETGLELNKLGS